MPVALETPLDRLLDPVAKCFTIDVAQRLADMRTDPGTQARIDQLAAMANEGILGPAEQAEYLGYVAAGFVHARKGACSCGRSPTCVSS